MCNSTEFFAWTALLATVTVAIIGGNIITTIVLWKLRSVLKRTYYLLINLTIADLVVGFGGVVLISTSILKHNGLDESPLFVTTRFLRMDVFANNASLTSLLLIAGERFLAVAFPFLHKVITTRFYAKCIAGVWITSLLLNGIVLSSDVFPTSFRRTISRGILGYFTIVCLIAISAFYITIWVVSRKVDVRIPRDKRDQNKRLAKTLAIVTIASLIAWIPLSVHTVSPFSKLDENCILSGSRVITYFLQLTNSVINPLVYCFRMSEFRAVLKQHFPTCRNANGRIRSVGATNLPKP
ncbi:adenosine receptor A1-like [Stylophora pistillata]|uniref:adenosine receptor A1-like n=1 Tax=Stylophora pistillata TaxID=50429 RepID=UPI000C056CDD|nr:adenosine receptor A1-like [Stylophora pistillata]